MDRLNPRQVTRLDAANRARFDTETELLLPAVRAALGMYLAALNRRVDQSAFGLNAPPPAMVAAAPIEAPTSDNPHHFTTTDAVQLQAVLDHAAPEWTAAMDSTLMPGMRTMLARIPIPVEHPAVAKAVEVWRSEWLAERTQILVGVPDTITSEIRFELDRLATERGTSVFDAKTAVKDLLSPDRLDWEAQRIARTEVVSANNNAMLASWRSLIGTLGGGVTARKTWIGGQRPTHSAVSGTTIGIDEKFRVGDSEMDGPGDGAGGASETVNCVVGSTRVEMPGLRAVTRRWFEGDVVTLCTASGNELTVTPNHPVLRADGRWIAAALVQEGDYLISGSLSGAQSAAPDVDDGPARIAEIYETAELAKIPKRVRGSVPNFHGDGTDREIEVVPIGGGLLIDSDAATEEQITQFGFELAYLAATPTRRSPHGRLSGRAPAMVNHGGRGGTPSSVRSRHARPTLSNGHLSHSGQHGIGCATGLHPSEKQPLPDSSSGHTEGRGEGLLRLSSAVAGSYLGVRHDAPGADRWPHFTGSEDCLPHAVHTDPSICGNLMQAFTGTVAADKVRFVSRSNFAGHVYNLDTGSGWYIGQSLLQRNCACSLSFEIDDAPRAEGSDGADQTATVTASAARADELVLTAAGDTPNTGACLMAYLSSEDAARLAVPGGEAPEDMHVTLALFDSPATDYSPEVQAMVDAALSRAWVQPIVAEAFATAVFNPDSAERDPCAVLLVQSDDLSNARDAMLAALAEVGDIDSEWTVGLDTTFPIWFPHVSVAYNADPSVIPPGSTGPVTFDRLVMAWGEDRHDLSNGPEPGQVLTAATQEQPMTAPTDTPPAPAADAPAEATGPTWSGPLALLGVPSSDNRKLGPNGTVRPLPQPLNWQHKSAQHHEGSSVVGRILTVEIRDGMIWGTGDWLPGWNEDVDKARQQVDGGLGLVSVDTVPGVVSFEDKAGNPIDPNTHTGDFDDVIVVFDEWELGGVTIVSFPAFADARIATDPGTETDTDDLVGGPLIMPGQTETFAGENPAAPTVSDDGTTVTLPDGTVVSIGDPVTFPGEDGADTAGTVTGIDPAGLTVTVALTPDGDADPDDGAEPVTVTVPIADLTPAGPPIDGTPAAAPAFSAAADTEVDALLASSTAHPYPASAFAKRELLGPTPLTLNRETNEVYGHFATRDTCHMGKLAQDGVCVTAPESPTGYDYFHLGEIITDQGPLPVGKITVGGGHAGPRVGFRGAVEHYDRTCTQVAVVRAYDDPYGGQFTGMLIPGVSDEKVEEMMRAGQLSGDWRMVKGNLELVAALAVNVPGFPVKRPATKYGMIGDRQVSLVAAGMVIPEENTDVVLPSGQTLPRSDWDALVAATFTAIQQHTAAARTPEPEVQALPVVDQLALRRASARLALLDSEAV